MNLGYAIVRRKGYSLAERDIIVNVFKEALSETLKQFYHETFQIRDISPQKVAPYYRIVVFVSNVPDPETPLKAILASMDNRAYPDLISEGLLEADENYDFLIANKVISGLCSKFAFCRGLAHYKNFKELAIMQKEIDRILKEAGL